MSAIFLSASVPDPKRNPKYYETSDNVAIRDAVTALVELVLPVGRLYFGGHPAITPMVRKTAERLGRIENVRNFQSEWYREYYPPDNQAFSHMLFVPAQESREQSEYSMRATMLHAEPLNAAFFIGGMEGIEREYQMVQELSAVPWCFPVASTGGASFLLMQEYAERLNLTREEVVALSRDADYLTMLEKLLRKSGFYREDGRSDIIRTK